MLNINPMRISGDWLEGFVLDMHTVSSKLIGYNEYGHEVYDTKRSEIGELLYRIKYGEDQSVLADILETVVHFVSMIWKINKNLDY